MNIRAFRLAALVVAMLSVAMATAPIEGKEVDRMLAGKLCERVCFVEIRRDLMLTSRFHSRERHITASQTTAKQFVSEIVIQMCCACSC